jgi:hypothetical protein
MAAGAAASGAAASGGASAMYESRSASSSACDFFSAFAARPAPGAALAPRPAAPFAPRPAPRPPALAATRAAVRTQSQQARAVTPRTHRRTNRFGLLANLHAAALHHASTAAGLAAATAALDGHRRAALRRCACPLGHHLRERSIGLLSQLRPLQPIQSAICRVRQVCRPAMSSGIARGVRLLLG